jgi:hypothetical protein
MLSSPPSGDANRDASLLLSAIRAGAVFTVVDAVASPGGLDFHASAGTETIPMGGTVPTTPGKIKFAARADVPPDASILLLRNGEVIARREGGALEHEADDPGSYRVEVMVPQAPGNPQIPWVLSNPIFWFGSAPAPALPTPPAAASSPLAIADWHTEVSAGSRASVRVEEPGVRFTYELAAGNPASQFAALVHDLRAVPEFAGIAFRASASHPMRVSAQLRFAQDGLRRWKRSFYLDQTERIVRIPIAELRPADGPGALPSTSRATSLLLVVDLTNSVPGARGDLTIRDLGLER